MLLMWLSDSEVSACNAGNLNLIPLLGTPMEKGIAPEEYPSILAWKIPCTEEPGGLHGITKVAGPWGCRFVHS